MKIAVLQTGRAAENLRTAHGDYDEMCKALIGLAPSQADTVPVLDGAFPNHVDDYDLFLITGSRHGVYEDHDWIAPLERLLRDAYAAKKKIIGVCFGHQILAQALGGVVEKSARGFGVGVMDYVLKDENGETRDLSLYAWHQDQIVTPPDDAEIIASSEFCTIAGLRYADTAISFQPHPEFSKGYMAGLIEARRGGVISEELADKAAQSLTSDTDTPIIQEMLARFLAQ